MQSDWLDAFTVHLSREELKLMDWMEAPMIGDEDLPDCEEELTNLEDCGIITGE